MSDTERKPLYIEDPDNDLTESQDYPYWKFDAFFRQRAGWLPTMNDDAYLQKWFYDDAFSDREMIVNPEALEMLPPFATPDVDCETSIRAVLHGPFLDLSGQPNREPQPLVVDLGAFDADERVTEFERKAREMSSLDVVRAVLYGRQ